MSIKEWMTKVMQKLNSAGRVYDASWTAASSSANGVILTDTLTLPKGTYVVVASIPPTSGVMAIGLWDSVNAYANRYVSVIQGYYMSASWIVEVTQDSMTINLRSAGSASVTYNTTYGRLKAIRIGGGA